MVLGVVFRNEAIQNPTKGIAPWFR